MNCNAQVLTGRLGPWTGEPETRECRNTARYLFVGKVGWSVPEPRCVRHSGKGLLAEGALPGWVVEVVDLRTDPTAGGRICQTCGEWVVDQAKHDRYHAEHGTLLAYFKEAVEA